MKQAGSISVLAAALVLAATPPLFAEEAAPPAPAAAAPAPSPVEKLDKVRAEQIDADKEARAAQERVEAVDDETQKMLADYRRALAETESQEAYAAQLTQQVKSQQDELANNQKQLDEIETTARAITPLEERMLATLKQFVELDVPFLLEERRARIATLETMMGRADVSISEKYRRIVEAYQVELDYGRTLESYGGKLAGGGAERTVRFLRVGRVTLLYQTLDGAETGYWDATRHAWVVDNSYAHAFKQGVAVANKTSAPEMLTVPVPAPEEAKS